MLTASSQPTTYHCESQTSHMVSCKQLLICHLCGFDKSVIWDLDKVKGILERRRDGAGIG